VFNILAMMGSYSFKKVIDYLRNETDINLYRLISSSPCYTANAIVRKLFKGAIEAGDAITVSTLLRDLATKINPDLEICHAWNAKWTPIERESSLRNLALIKLLLKHHVDGNKSYLESAVKGGLNNAIIQQVDDDSVRIDKYQRVDMEIIELLLYAGGHLDTIAIPYIITARDEELFMKIVRKLAQSQHNKWTKEGVFLLALKHLRVQACEELVTLLE
jgi:hypothetical protein